MGDTCECQLRPRRKNTSTYVKIQGKRESCNRAVKVPHLYTQKWLSCHKSKDYFPSPWHLQNNLKIHQQLFLTAVLLNADTSRISQHFMLDLRTHKVSHERIAHQHQHHGVYCSGAQNKHNSSRPQNGLSHNEKRFRHQPIKTFDLNNQLGYPSISQILMGNKSGAIDHSIELL